MYASSTIPSAFEAALSVLEVLRVDLHEWRQSPDLLTAVERCAARRADEATQMTSCSSSPSARPPAPPFHFRPLATAPATCVLFSPHRPHRVASRPRSTKRSNSAAHGTEAGQRASTASPPAPVPDHPTDVSTTTTTAAASITQPAPFLRLSSPAAQRLYTDMAERGRAVPLSAPNAADQWRRRTAAPDDAELRRAVRDYLYRMHILSRLDAPASDADAPLDAFADAVLNGTALCQLVASLLHDGVGAVESDGRVDAVPCRCPRTLEEVRVNYAAALTALRGAPAAALEQIPAASWGVVPEDVYRAARPTALLLLFLHLISTYLPAPEELPAWRRAMTWQPSADRPALSTASPADLAAAEDAGCAFLHAAGVLPDAAVYNLPGPECLLPPATAAPFMASWKTYVVRTAAPNCLLVPSIWPYLCNGVLLVLLARKSGAEAAARAGGSVSVGRFFANPRTVACCMKNISTAFASFQAVSPLTTSLPFFTADSAAAVLRGDRVHIISLLLHLRDVLAVKEVSPALLRRCAAVKPGARADAAADAQCRTPEGRAQRSALPSHTPATAVRAAGERSASSSAAASTLRRLTPATIAKGVMRRRSSPPAPSPPSASTPAAHADPAAAAAVVAGSATRRGAGDVSWPRGLHGADVQHWLTQVLEPGFHYASADASFVVDARHLDLSEPCWVFADGVVLAHVIRRLECRRCDFLDCVQPSSKKAARLFNVRRCLEFLRSSAGVVWDVALLDEALVQGRASGVLAVLQALRAHYGAVGKGAGLHGELRGSAAALTA